MLKNSSYKTHSLYQLIVEATDDLLESENEELNKQICSEILRTSDGPKVAAKVINKILLKALSNKCGQSIWYCLLLLDLAVKSTNARFCAAILAKDFFGDLIKIIEPKNQVAEFVQEKFLYIIKEWYTSLTNVPGYQNLLKFYKGTITPAVPKDTFSSIQRPYPVEQSVVSYYHAPSPQINPQGLLEKEKIIRDVDIIETNTSIFSDTLRSINPEQMSNEECQFLKDLHETIKKMQVRINDILPQTEWEDVINQLLQVNDKINSTSERYMRLMTSKAQKVLVTSQDRAIVKDAIAEIYDGTYSLSINDNKNKVIADIYDMPSLPSYDEASSNLNKIHNAQPSQELNLINFDEENTPSFYKNQPLPPIPANSNKDLLNDPLPVTSDSQNHLSSDDFDSFIESIARRHKPKPDQAPEEDYAPPLYDEATLK